MIVVMVVKVRRVYISMLKICNLSVIVRQCARGGVCSLGDGVM